jgi:hypothetical protein
MRSMSILEEMLGMFATTVQAELNVKLHVCDIRIFLGLVPKESPVIINPFPSTVAAAPTA